MSKETERVKGFLEEYYIDNPQMGSPDMSAAIRDLLTDLIHICDEEGIDIQSRLNDAEKVFNEENC
jgi:predicted RNA-binding protein associated with RNAse of E/G family